MHGLIRWETLFLKLFEQSPSIKLVGATINIQPPDLQLGSRWSPHVQSYCMVMDSTCLDYLLGTTSLFEKPYNNKFEVIQQQEIMTSTLVLQHNWNISCLVPEYQGIDYRRSSSYLTGVTKDVLWGQNNLGRPLHPYEVVFFKTDRNFNQDIIETLTNQNLSVEDYHIIPCPSIRQVKIAICFHLGYGHLFDQFEQFIHNTYMTGHHVDLYVTYQKKIDPLYLIRQKYPKAVLIQTTRGCDTGAFLVQMEYILRHHLQYDYIFKFHTKKREDWRADLLDSIASSTDVIHEVIETFRRDPRIGMICGHKKWILSPDSTNEPLISKICQGFKLTVGNDSKFVGGTIFWTRWNLFKNFIESRSIDLTTEYQKCELGYLLNNRPTYTHSWERVFGYIINDSHSSIVARTLSSPTYLVPKPVITDDTSHVITQIRYGLSEKEYESIDVTARIRQQTPVFLRTLKLSQLGEDPYPHRCKRLSFYMGSQKILYQIQESCNVLRPNNLVIQIDSHENLILKIEEMTNFETASWSP